MTNYIALAFVAGYLSISLFIGYYFKGKIKSATDFLVAGRNLTTPFLTFTLIMTQLGAGFLVGAAELVHTHGTTWAALWQPTAYSASFFITAFLIGMILRSKAMTPPDFVESRFGIKGRSVIYRGIYVAAYTLFLAGLMGAQYMVAGYLFSSIGISYTWGVLIAAVIILIYCYMAGLWGVAGTDLFQGIVVISGVFILFVLGITQVHGMAGWPGLTHFFSTDTFVPKVHLGYYLLIAFGSLFGFVTYDMFQRYAAAKNVSVGRKSLAIAGVFLAFFGFMIGSIARIGGFLYPGAAAGEVLFETYMGVIPYGLGLLFVAAIIAAVMSTADSLLVASGNAVSRDLYHKILNPDKKFDELPHSLTIARASPLIFTIIGIVVALNFTGILVTIGIFAALFIAAGMGPVVIAFIGKGGSKIGLELSVIATTSIMIVAFLTIPESMWGYVKAACFPVALVIIPLATFLSPEGLSLEEKIQEKIGQ